MSAREPRPGFGKPARVGHRRDGPMTSEPSYLHSAMCQSAFKFGSDSFLMKFVTPQRLLHARTENLVKAIND